jgi:hypothetical protein
LTKKIEIVLILIFITIIGFGQKQKLTDEKINNSSAILLKLATPETCDEIEGWLESDFENETVFLYIQGGIAPVSYSTDQEFENKYGIYYYDFGCIAPEYKCILKYNFLVFEYLDSEYDKKWKRKIRKDVIGFNEWKKRSNNQNQ